MGREPAKQHSTTPTEAGHLQALTSSFTEEQHGTYITHLMTALDNEQLLNIALTGNYGIGKSSILDEVRRRRPKRTLSLTLSSLGDTTATTPEAPPPGHDAVGTKATLSNRIQKEVVKQLLYRNRPSRVPRSRFRRLGKFRTWPEALKTAPAVAALGLVLFLLNVLPKPPGSADGPVRTTAAYFALLVVVTALVTLARRLINPRWSVAQLSAAGTSVSLSNSETYFDQYLDEIVYAFEVNDTDLVIFEDIDRFEDVHIFEALRELNTLLNQSEQVKQPVRFIYAIKDSVFELLGEETLRAEGADAADTELARANRTKFFDLVIPVVPFITHRSARDLMTTTFTTNAAHQVSSALIDLTAKYLTDMRLIKNICNEFTVFGQRLLDTDKGVPGLQPDALLAMVIYKNIHLSDFERISRGTSSLDVLYRHSRDVVEQTIARLEQDNRALSQQLADHTTVRSRAKRFGVQLERYTKRVARHVQPNAVPSNWRLGGSSIEEGELVKPEFWRNLTEGGGPLAFTVRNPQTYQQTEFSLTVEDLREALNDSLNPARWAERDEEVLRARQDRLVDRIAAVRRADMAELAQDADNTLTIDDGSVSFNDLVEATLTSRLAVELVRAGFIDRNFTLYVSQYYGVRVSADVMNFIVHNVQPGVTDMHYTFPGTNDIDALLEEVGDSFLEEPSAYNIALVDHLVEHDHDRLRVVMSSLTSLGEREREFLNAYLQGGTQTESFAGQLAHQWDQTFAYLVDDADVSEPNRTRLIDAALHGADPDVTYDVPETFREFIQDHAADLPALTTDAPEVTAIASVLTQAEVDLDDITGLAPAVKVEVIEGHLYNLSAKNLHAIVPGDSSLALDSIRAQSEAAYEYCAGNLPRYLDLIDADPLTTHTIVDGAAFAAILTDLAEDLETSDVLDRVIAGACPDCVITDLSQVPAAIWPALARTNRTVPTYANLTSYVTNYEGVDEALCRLLTTHRAITDHESAEEADKEKLAATIINARDQLPEPQRRTALAGSLALKAYLAPEVITPEPGRLLASLLREDLVEDSIEAFERFNQQGWETLEEAIEASENFADIITPDLVDEETVPALLNSSRVPHTVKARVLTDPDAYTPTDDVDAWAAIAQAALTMGVDPSTAHLSRMATVGVRASTLVPLIGRSEKSLTDAELVTMLSAVGGQYESLTRAGSRAKLTFPRDDAHEALLARLRTLGTVRNFRKTRKAETIDVEMT